jgi:hypothetical protein
LSKIVRSGHQLPIGTSPLPAERRIGLEPNLRKSELKIKNPARAPGESVHRIRRQVRAPLGRMCSKLDFFLSGIRNQPHLWMSRQARSVSRLSPESGLHQLPASIAKSKIPSSCIHDSFRSFFGVHLWISPAVVENRQAGEAPGRKMESGRVTIQCCLHPNPGRRHPIPFETKVLNRERPCPCP